MESMLSSKSLSYDNSTNDCGSHADTVLATSTNKIGGSNNNSSSNVPGLKFTSNHSVMSKHDTMSNGQHQLMSANSFELNGMTTSSLSEDSGLPPTTNSSISSGDSSRFGLCKSAFELIESDGEVSQFDSLDTFSDGGMSTENFNTMKKVRLAPIDPPPEFQDSPQTTLLRSPAIQTFSLQLSQHILSKAMTICSTIAAESNVSTPTLTRARSLECLEKTCANCIYDSVANNDDYIFQPAERRSFDNYFQEYSHHHIYDIYASDSMLNRHIDNIYDVPCDESTNVSTSIESLAEPSAKVFNRIDSPKLSERIQRRSVKEQQRENQMKMERASEIHDYDLYYRKESNRQQSAQSGTSLKPFTLTSSFIESDADAMFSKNTKAHTSVQRNVGGPFNANTNASTTSSSTTTSTTTLQRRKNPSILYSPLHYHASSNLSTGNRPNSRNSLNSRLSSSHNSLTIATSNKADDSIFITQAMSHDALTGREISDFYNVPIDSDIYALPIDVIRPKSVASCRGGGASGSSIPPLKCTSDINAKTKTASMKTINTANGSAPSLSLLKSSKAIHGRLKYVRNNRKRKNLQQTNGGDVDLVSNGASCAVLAKANDKRNSVSDNVAEPMHMMLDEVKRFYSNLYTNSTSNVNGSIGARTKEFGAACGASSSVADDRIVNNNINNNNNNNNSVNKCAQSNSDSDRNNNGNSNANGTSGGTINSNNIIINNGSSSCSTNNNNILINNNIINSSNKNSSNNFNNYHVNNNNYNNNCESTATAATVTTPSSSTPSHSNASSNKVANNASKLSNSRCNTSKHSLNNSKSVSSITVNSITKENEYISTSSAGVTASSLTPATKKSQFSINLNLKQKFCSIFRFRKSFHQSNGGNQRNSVADVYDSSVEHTTIVSDKKVKFSTRALPPLPPKDMKAQQADSLNVKEDAQEEKTQDPMDFAANIEKVKEYGWYWGPISSEAAEKILSNEPDGSFIVRDSSDDHYIFSLTFKLNNSVRHVRIEQDQGTFSFGSCAKFKSRTIMEFIENAVESSRSGRYLFFFHRRPEHGPMRVQLTNPVSRFKHIQSLQHMCRFVIRRAVVRKDLIQTLPLPRRLLDYLSYKNCYSELVESDGSQSPSSETVANNAAVDNDTPTITR